MVIAGVYEEKPRGDRRARIIRGLSAYSSAEFAPPVKTHPVFMVYRRSGKEVVR